MNKDENMVQLSLENNVLRFLVKRKGREHAFNTAVPKNMADASKIAIEVTAFIEAAGLDDADRAMVLGSLNELWKARMAQ